MRDIKELIDNIDKYKTSIIQKRFSSKKNTVAYVILNGQPRILKWFVPGLKQNLENEYNILKKGFSNLSIPCPFEKDLKNNVLIMSYIIGENICDILNDIKKNFNEKVKVIKLLANWFMSFHTFFKTEKEFRVRGDPNLKNFILNREHIWGVDFEESRIGKPIEDLAGFCASLLSSDPMFTEEKFQFCQIFLNAYQKSVQWNITQINKEISYALLERIQWRIKDEEVLRKYANKIRDKGLQQARYNF